MKKMMKVSELSYPALDWAVCKASGFGEDQFSVTYNPSTSADYSLPIIFREGISTIFCGYDTKKDPDSWATAWAAVAGRQEMEECYDEWGEHWGKVYQIPVDVCYYGPNPLVAGMRCYVASELGDEVEVPEELL